jgi:hypothetical protein
MPMAQFAIAIFGRVAFELSHELLFRCGSTALHFASQNGYLNVVEELTPSGTGKRSLRVNAKNK